MVNNLEKIVNNCTDEIISTINWSIENFKRNHHISNYWINNNFNVFAETGVNLDTNNEIERQYIILKLEQYDNKDNCINIELDYQESIDMQIENISDAVNKLLNRNIEILNLIY